MRTGEEARWLVESRVRLSGLLAGLGTASTPLDILLILYAAAEFGERMAIGTIAEKIDAPLTTVLRWLIMLERRNEITRENDPYDARRVLIELTPDTRERIQLVIIETLSWRSDG